MTSGELLIKLKGRIIEVTTLISRIKAYAYRTHPYQDLKLHYDKFLNQHGQDFVGWVKGECIKDIYFYSELAIGLKKLLKPKEF